MAKSVWEKAGEEARAAYNKANAGLETKSDSFLDKLKGSKWTGIILLAAGAVVVLAVLF